MFFKINWILNKTDCFFLFLSDYRTQSYCKTASRRCQNSTNNLFIKKTTTTTNQYGKSARIDRSTSPIKTSVSQKSTWLHCQIHTKSKYDENQNKFVSLSFTWTYVRIGTTATQSVIRTFFITPRTHHGFFTKCSTNIQTRIKWS